jgi:shikimate kinase
MTTGERVPRPAGDSDIAEDSPDGESRRVVLVGMMGSGKTTVGRLVAQRLGVGFVDTDQHVESEVGMSVREIFDTQGEAAFRRAEKTALADLLTSGSKVVAAGGGCVIDGANRSVMKQRSTVVWLRTRVGTLAKRVGSGEGRPLLTGDAARKLEEIERERLTLYSSVADVIIDTDDLSPDKVTDAVMEKLSPVNW